MIQGFGFSLSFSLFCRFDSVDIAALFLSSSLLSCVSPVHIAGFAPVEVSNNHVDFSTSGISYEYRDPLLITNISPSRGPEIGGSFVTVYGSGFYTPNSGIWCRFGVEQNVSAVYVSDTHISCVSPPYFGTRQVKVQVTTNNEDFAESEGIFIYDAVIHIDRVTPSSAVYLGGSVMTVFGANFINSDNLSCQFVDRGDLYLLSSYRNTFGSSNGEPWSSLSGVESISSYQIVPASWISASLIFCRVPGLPPGFYAVEVSNNGVDFTTQNVLLLVAPELQI